MSLVTSRQQSILKRMVLTAFFVAALIVANRIALVLGDITIAPTVAFCLLILVLLSAFFGDMFVAITTSVAATLCFNYFYLSPVGTFSISAFSDWISLAAFLLAALGIGGLTSAAAAGAAGRRQLERSLEQLRNFGAWLLSIPVEQLTLSGIAEQGSRIFALEYCAIHVYSEGSWHHFMGAATSDISREIASHLSGDDHSADLMEMADENALGVRYMRIDMGSLCQAVLTIRSESMPASVLASMAYMIGLRLVAVVKEGQPWSLSVAR